MLTDQNLLKQWPDEPHISSRGETRAHDREVEDIVISHDVSSADSWDTFVKCHPQGSPFHLMAWQRMIHDSFHYKPEHIMARSPQGKILGVLPLFLVRSLLFGRMLISTPRLHMVAFWPAQGL